MNVKGATRPLPSPRLVPTVLHHRRFARRSMDGERNRQHGRHRRHGFTRLPYRAIVPTKFRVTWQSSAAFSRRSNNEGCRRHKGRHRARRHPFVATRAMASMMHRGTGRTTSGRQWHVAYNVTGTFRRHRWRITPNSPRLRRHRWARRPLVINVAGRSLTS